MTRPLRSARITRHHRYYETVRPCASPPVLNPLRLITSWSAPSRPGAPPGTLSRRQVPAFPCRSPDQARATYMPDTTWAVSRYPPDSSQRQDQSPVLMSSELSTLQRWFAHARLLDPHLTRSRHAVSASLTTPALNRRSMRWFEATPCRAAPEGPPPSPAQLLASAEPDLHRLLPPAHAAHDLRDCVGPCRPSQRAGLTSGMPMSTVVREPRSICASLSVAPARLTLRPSISPSQPSCSASAMRAIMLSRISAMRAR